MNVGKCRQNPLLHSQGGLKIILMVSACNILPIALHLVVYSFKDYGTHSQEEYENKIHLLRIFYFIDKASLSNPYLD